MAALPTFIAILHIAILLILLAVAFKSVWFFFPEVMNQYFWLRRFYNVFDDIDKGYFMIRLQADAHDFEKVLNEFAILYRLLLFSFFNLLSQEESNCYFRFNLLIICWSFFVKLIGNFVQNWGIFAGTAQYFTHQIFQLFCCYFANIGRLCPLWEWLGCTRRRLYALLAYHTSDSYAKYN